MDHLPTDHEMSLEKHVRLVQGCLAAGASDSLAVERQAQQDAKEIADLGLTERAWQEFTSRLPTAHVQQWSIGYFMTKDTVWCDFRYVVAPDLESKQKEFGFRRNCQASWQIIWDEPVLMEIDNTQLPPST